MTVAQRLWSATRWTPIADRIRAHVVDMCAGPEGGHLGGALSCADVLTALYFWC